MRYFIETICGGNDAAGGGCGGPLGVMEVTEERFNDVSGRTSHCFHEHNEWETGYKIGEDESIRVKLVFRPCMSCRRSV